MLILFVSSFSSCNKEIRDGFNTFKVTVRTREKFNLLRHSISVISKKATRFLDAIWHFTYFLTSQIWSIAHNLLLSVSCLDTS